MLQVISDLNYVNPKTGFRSRLEPKSMSRLSGKVLVRTILSLTVKQVREVRACLRFIYDNDNDPPMSSVRRLHQG